MTNTFKSIKRGLAATALAALLMAPAANARILNQETSGPATSHEVAAISYTAPQSSGFQWDDAALGAAVAVGIVAILGAGAGRMRRRRLTTTS